MKEVHSISQHPAAEETLAGLATKRWLPAPDEQFFILEYWIETSGLSEDEVEVVRVWVKRLKEEDSVRAPVS